MTILFRQAQPADASVILPMMRDYYTYDGHDFEPEKHARALDELLSDSRLGLVLLVFDGQTPVGYAAIAYGFSLEFGGRDAFLDEIHMVEAYRGRGIGRTAIEHLITHCREQGIKAMHLEVVESNIGAYAAYEKIGFERRDSRMMSLYIS